MPIIKRKKSVVDHANPNEIAKVLSALRKQHGQETITAAAAARQPWRIPSGVFSFDLATLGGIPHDRISMVHGPKHSGKSYMAMRIAMGAQQTIPDQQVVWIDVENTYDAVWGGKIGVDNDAMHLVRPDSGEQAVDITVALVHTREVSLIVVDSLAALIPIKEQEEDAEKSLVALQSRLITSMLRKITAAQIQERKRGHHVTVLVLNQQRSKIGGWSPTGDPISLPGGKALGHFTSLEWRMKNKENITKNAEGEETLAFNDHAFTIEKNKLNAGYRTGEFRMLRRLDEATGLSEGEVDDAPFMLALAKARGIYQGTPKAGYTLEFGDNAPIKASSGDEMIQRLYEDRDSLWSLRCHLLAEEATRQGMPDWFLSYLRGE